MAGDSPETVIALLEQAEAAHGVYESTELHGVYDQAWPTWYAAYAVEHGLGALIGHSIAAEDLARFLAGRFAEFEALEPKPTETWATYTARRITAEL